MMIIALLLDPGSQARTILHHLLERADIAGSDAAGRTVITFAQVLHLTLRTFPRTRSSAMEYLA